MTHLNEFAQKVDKRRFIIEGGKERISVVDKYRTGSGSDRVAIRVNGPQVHPVATAPGSVFVDPRLRPLSLPDTACPREFFAESARCAKYIVTVETVPDLGVAALITAVKPRCVNGSSEEASIQTPSNGSSNSLAGGDLSAKGSSSSRSEILFRMMLS